MGIRIRSRVRIGPPFQSVDPDAQLFITNAAITDLTQQIAINNLVVALKGYSIWTKFKTIYPMVGGTATTHKYNLKNPLDTNAAFRLTFSGGWTHSPTGAKPNGTNAFANTYLTPSISLTTNYASLHYYSRTSTTENGVSDQNGTVIGVRADLVTVNNTLTLQVKTSPNNLLNFFYSLGGATTNNFARTTETIGTGFFSGVLSLNNSKVYKNGVNVTTSNLSVSRNTPNRVTYLGAINDKGISAEYSLKESAFAAIADTLTDTEVANLYTSVQAYQTTLGRNI